MKKFYFLLVAAVVALSANALSFTVVLSDYSAATVDTYYSGPGRQPLTIDPATATGIAEFPDDGGMHYLYITPVKPNTINEITAYNESGEQISSKTGKFSSMQVFLVPLTIDGGRLYIQAGELLPDAKISVTLVGDPSKVVFSCNRTPHDLVEGTQEFEYFSMSDKPVYIVPHGVAQLYRVTVNGNELPAYETSMGDWQYSYEQENGDHIVIETEYPDNVVYNLSILYPDEIAEAFTVKVDGVEVADPKAFTAKANAKLAVDIDDYNYKITKMERNGQQCEYYSGGYHMPVLADLTLSYEGHFIERPYDFVVYTHNWDIVDNDKINNYGYQFYTAPGQALPLVGGYNMLKFCDTDNPFFFNHYVESTFVNVYLNDEYVMEDMWGGYDDFNFNHGDVMKIYLLDEVPEYTVTYQVSDLNETPTIVKDHITPVTDLEVAHMALPGTHLAISGEGISNVLANGEELEADANGVYNLAVDGNTDISIKGTMSGVTNVATEAASTSPRIFNLQGIEVTGTRLPVGLYIVDGQLTLIK